MMKYVLLGSAMAIATPAIAQEAATTTTDQSMAAESQAMPSDAPVTTESDTATSADPKDKTAETAATQSTESAPVETATMPAATPADPAAPMTTAPTSPAASQAAPAQSTQANPAPVTPAAPGTPAQTAAAPAAPAQQAAQSAEAQPAGGDQVASIVESEFGSYDKDRNGTLDKVEFAAWMDALKAKAPDSAGKPSDPKWNEAAFAQADTDKSTSVTKQELMGFLGGGSRAGAM